jgi:hypothetical protein
MATDPPTDPPTTPDAWKRRFAYSSAVTPYEAASVWCGWSYTTRTIPDLDLHRDRLQEALRAVRTRNDRLPVIDNLRWPETPDERHYHAWPCLRPIDVWQYGRAVFPDTCASFTAEDFPGLLNDLRAAALPQRLQQLLKVWKATPASEESQKKKAQRIMKAMPGVKEREATAYAALIRPDDEVQADQRAAKKRSAKLPARR